MSNRIRRVLWTIGFFIIMMAMCFMAWLTLSVRVAHPEYTETQIFFVTLKPSLMAVPVLLIGAILAYTNKDAFDQ